MRPLLASEAIVGFGAHRPACATGFPAAFNTSRAGSLVGGYFLFPSFEPRALDTYQMRLVVFDIES